MKRARIGRMIVLLIVCCFFFASMSFAEADFSLAEMQKVSIARQSITSEECHSLEARESNCSRELFHIMGGDEAEIVARILWFIPNRTMDVLDIVSFQIGLALRLRTPGFHITRFCNILELSIGWEEGIGWLYRRNLCLYGSMEHEANLLALTGYYFNTAGVGTNWLGDYRAGSGEREHKKPLTYNRLSEAIYADEVRDPWGIGSYDDFEIHPVEIVDAIVGWLTFGFVDISADDYGP